MRNIRYAHIDEKGKIILPPGLAEEWGLLPGDKMPLETAANLLNLRYPSTKLRRVYLEITNRCNLNCTTCIRNVWDAQDGYISQQTFERIVAGVQTISPRPEIFLGGYGEPLFHPACLDMLERAKSLDLRVSMITNGILLNEDVCHKLVDLGVDMLWISLDGATPESYCDIRLGSALPRVIENLKRLREIQYQRFGFSTWLMKPRLGIAFVAMQRNIQDLPEVIRLGNRLGIEEYSISNVLAYNKTLYKERLYDRSLSQTNHHRVSEFIPIVRVPKMDVNDSTAPVIHNLLMSANRLELSGSELAQNGDQCPFVERGSIAIRWDGKASPCIPLLYTHTYYLEERLRTNQEYFIGDINKDELSAIWKEPDYMALRERLQKFDFSPCTFCNSCELADQNLEDCFGNGLPACGGCLWAQGLIRCP